MAKSQPRRHTKGSGKSARVASTPDWPILGLAALGMLITAYLTAVAWWQKSAAFCSAGSGCDVIQQSQWSTVLGLPLSLWGFAVYALIGVLAYRPASRLRRWKRIWTVSLIGVVISLYLTVVGIVQLDALCGWCLASLATISAIFITAAVRHPPSAPDMPWSSWVLNTGGAALVAIAVLHVYYHHDTLLGSHDDASLQALATHLDKTGAKFYGASWCSHCQQQKRFFGNAKSELPYVECTPSGRGGPTAPECARRNIDAFPTWIIRGRRFEQVLTPDELADYSGFDWEEQGAE